MFEVNVRSAELEGRIVVRSWALAGQREVRRLRPAADSAATALVGDHVTGDLEVDAVGLADVIDGSGFPRIDLFKMDIEGAEHEVFASAHEDALRSVANGIIESHPV